MIWKTLRCKILGHKWSYAQKHYTTHGVCERCQKCSCMVLSKEVR